MNSPFANLFLAIQQRIQDKVPSIRFIDQELGQLDFYRERPAVSWPCALIDIDAFSFTQMLELAQTGAGNIIVRLGFPPYSASNNLTPQLYREKALQHYDIEFNVIKALHGWCPDNTDADEAGGFGSMIRVNSATERREDPIRVRALSFSLGMEDYITKRDYITIVGDYSKKDHDIFDFDTGPKLAIS